MSVFSLMQGGTLLSGGPLTSNLESFQAFRLINSELNTTSSSTVATSTFDLIYKSDSMSVTDQAYQDAVNASLAPIVNDSHVVKITTPYGVPAQTAQNMTSRDGHEALVLVEIKSTGRQARTDYNALRAQVKS